MIGLFAADWLPATISPGAADSCGNRDPMIATIPLVSGTGGFETAALARRLRGDQVAGAAGAGRQA